MDAETEYTLVLPDFVGKTLTLAAGRAEMEARDFALLALGSGITTLVAPDAWGRDRPENSAVTDRQRRVDRTLIALLEPMHRADHPDFPGWLREVHCPPDVWLLRAPGLWILWTPEHVMLDIFGSLGFQLPSWPTGVALRRWLDGGAA